jgi:hypothetical protein
VAKGNKWNGWPSERDWWLSERDWRPSEGDGG